MPTAIMTSEELVQALRRSQLPTVLVEGRNDMTIYRWIESCNCLGRVDVIQCGGRNTLLEIFDRRAEFDHLPHAFIADRDMWTFTKIPDEYKEIVFTRGYSIENDLLDGSCVSSLLSPPEETGFEALCEILARWFAFEIEQYRKDLEWHVSFHPNQLGSVQ